MSTGGISTRKITECPVCGSDIKYKYTIKKFKEPFSISECIRCGLQLRDEIPENPESYYSEDYYSGKADFSYTDERRYRKYDSFVWKSRLRSIKKIIRPPAALLDAGCAFGGFVREAQLAGYDAYGIDVSEYAVNHAVCEGLKVFQSGLNAAPFPDSFFDVITLIEVIEHLHEPVKTVKELYRLLKPGGLIVIQTADMNGLQARNAGPDYHYYLPGHLVYYSYSNLKLLLESHGFSGVKAYRPADISLYSKLRKSAGRFSSLKDYFKWIQIIKYHLLSKIYIKDSALTSSMVVYARKASG